MRRGGDCIEKFMQDLATNIDTEEKAEATLNAAKKTLRFV